MEGSLTEFVRAAWSSIDPSPYQDSWAIEALCEHLEAVTTADIRRLLVNYPPRCGKTNVASICWPAWTWARRQRSYLSGPAVKFLCGSYSNVLSLQNSNMTRRLILSPWYQERWGRTFSLREDQNTKGQYDNTEGGSRIATSVGGSLLGIGGNVICFPADEMVRTADGLKPIGKLVRERSAGPVWSFNTRTGEASLKPIIGWHTNPASPLVEVGLSDGCTLRCTPQHKIWTTNRGWVEAVALRRDDLLPASGWMHVAATAQVNDGQPQVSPDAVPANARDGADADAVFVSQKRGRVVVSAVDFAHHFFGKVHRAIGKRSMPLAVVDVLQSCAVFEIIKSWVGSVAVDVADFLSLWAWADKSLGYHFVAESVEGAAVASKSYARIALIENARHDPLGENEEIVIAGAGVAPHASVAGNIVTGKINHRTPLFVRVVGHADKTFCLTVADNHTFCVGDGNIIVKNCTDDPHNTQEVESEAERETVLNWWREVRSTRLNDPKQSAIVVIMQRLHQEDVSGVILGGADADEWTHLMIPMAHDSRRHCVTVLKWDQDGEPAKVWEDPRTVDGELMWPERFGPKEVKALERGLGAYMASGRLQQSPTPSGGGIFKRDWWQLFPPDGEAFHPETGKPLKPLVYPAMDYIVASVDTAYTEKEENDWSACTVWGSYRNEHDLPKIMLMDAWQARLEFRPLVERIMRTCTDLKVDRLLIEAKANGISVAQEIGRLMRGQEFPVALVNPRGDKVARAHAVTGLFEGGLIYAPDRKWADMVMEQASMFPKGSHDDLVDSMCCALKHMRDTGVALLRDEREEDMKKRYGLKSPRQTALPYQV